MQGSCRAFVVWERILLLYYYWPYVEWPKTLVTYSTLESVARPNFQYLTVISDCDFTKTVEQKLNYLWAVQIHMHILAASDMSGGWGLPARASILSLMEIMGDIPVLQVHGTFPNIPDQGSSVPNRPRVPVTHQALGGTWGFNKS